ncbi:acetylornithine/succinylornithine family transaminase [Candidatus Woesearchaeota archaeon]|nr:acetylornithine/succinylornithine family transaminase [Candidatus Woesearchaeota archaeon]
MKSIREIEDKYLFPIYPKRQTLLARGKGALVWDDQGRAYIDCVAGHGVAIVGHCHDRVVAALHAQAQTLITCTTSFYNPARAQLLQRLIEITPETLTRAFLCNSGTESVEAALKFARFTTKKTEFICAMRNFHGRTFGSMSATFTPDYREPFEPLVPGFHFVPFNDFAALEQKITEQTAGVLLEVVQGEGGVNVGDTTYFQQVRDICTQRNILLIIDEVQTGFGRTGKLFACEHMDIQPDIMCIAKGIAGGFPMGATLCADKILVPTGRHGTTFGGNPLACAAASAAIEVIISEDLPKQAAEKGAYALQKLRAQQLDVRDIRGLGLMIGIELKEKVKPSIQQLEERGILAMAAGTTVLRLLPPLVITYEQLDKVVEEIVHVLKQ